MMMDEARLIEKLQAIEALFAGATTPGERTAAELALAWTAEDLEPCDDLDVPF